MSNCHNGTSRRAIRVVSGKAYLGTKLTSYRTYRFFHLCPLISSQESVVRELSSTVIYAQEDEPSPPTCSIARLLARRSHFRTERVDAWLRGFVADPIARHIAAVSLSVTTPAPARHDVATANELFTAAIIAERRARQRTIPGRLWGGLLGRNTHGTYVARQTPPVSTRLEVHRRAELEPRTFCTCANRIDCTSTGQL